MHFESGTGEARFSRVAAVGMEPRGKHKTALSFEPLYPRDAERCVTEALKSLEERLQGARPRRSVASTCGVRGRHHLTCRSLLTRARARGGGGLARTRPRPRPPQERCEG